MLLIQSDKAKRFKESSWIELFLNLVYVVFSLG